MRYLYVIWAMVWFVALFLLLFPFFLLLSLFKSWGRKAIWQLIRGWSYVWFFLIGMPVRRIYQQRPVKGKPYIVVANHASYIDTPLIFRAIPFFVRPLAKKELASIPLFGFLYRQMAVLVDRNDAKSKYRSVHMLRRTLQREGSIFIFPEGTFNETADPLKFFYDGAFRLALRTRTPILPVVFPDAVKRWHYRSFWSWSPGVNRAIFLPEVAVDNFAVDDIAGLKQKVFDMMWAAKRDAE
ncbi:lysophospholipid acyltransferase family protein [Taibaiella helva]|uniref:lysophospholipid acyltransferase family protein n=1 Tax=Taibaiella helva TaxID=2301235 RepID=UPI0013007F99|nr:lysophospholipid acyltransferase family protein [Taibaiella helva]